MEFKSSSTSVSFQNEPRLSSHEHDRGKNERRLDIVANLESILAREEMFAGKNVDVEFSSIGTSSTICFLTVEGERFVLKFRQNATALEGESEFLREWESVGVSVPHVYKESKFEDIPYLIMEYVDAPLLSEAIKKGDKSIEEAHFEMGQTMRKMHTKHAPGYGKIVQGYPEFATFVEWLGSKNVQRNIKYAVNNGLIPNASDVVSKAEETLAKYAKDNKPTYCHFDFTPMNTLATQPMTVFDPNPNMNLDIVDAGRSIMISIADTGQVIPAEKFKEGYFGDKDIDRDALLASIIVNACTKFEIWNKRGKTKHIDRIRTYITQHNLM